MSDEFKVGDTIQLQSGGPIMTVTGVVEGTNAKRIASVTWYSDKDDAYKIDRFDVEIFQAVRNLS